MNEKVLFVCRVHLSSLMQQQKNVSYLFSGSFESVMNQLFTTVKSPFYRFARITYLGNIKREAFEKFYKNILHKAEIEINRGLVNDILNFTKGHPYYSSLFLQQCLLHKNELVIHKKNAFEWLQNTVLDIEKPYLEKLWEDVSTLKDERMLIISLAEGKKPYTVLDNKHMNISRTLKKLENKSMILKSANGWAFSDPLFERWIQKVVLAD